MEKKNVIKESKTILNKNEGVDSLTKFELLKLVKEQKKIIFELDSVRSKYFGLFEDSPISYLQINEYDEINKSNESFSKLIGKERIEVFQTSFVDMILPSYKGKFTQYKANAIKGNSKQSFHLVLLNTNSEEIKVKVDLFSKENGALFILALTDLSIEEEQNQEISTLSIAIEQSANSIIITDVNGVITYVNRRFCRLSGYSKSEAIGNTPRILNSGKHDELFYKNIWDTLLSGEIWKGTFINKKKNNELYWESALITPLLNTEKEIIGFLSVKEDISINKKIEEMYDWKGILENANWGTVIRGEDGMTIKSLNPTFASMHGYNEGELIGLSVSVLLPEDELERLQEMNRLILEKGKFSYESIHIRKDGSRFPVEINASIIRNDKGEVKNFVITLFDITDKKNLEIKNKEINDSIHYAKTIQKALLPGDSFVKKYLKDYFVIYKPKDVVAGDFYWVELLEDGTVLFAAADCTGHGVPGAMVSVVCSHALNQAVREFRLSEPAEILNKTREVVINEFEKSGEDVKDGMDISLCAIKGDTIHWAGAHNPLWICREGEMIEIRGDRQPVGKFYFSKPFTSHSLQLKKGDVIYSFTDGFADQFGGPKWKKFKAANMKELFLSVQDKSMEKQAEVIAETFEKWKGKLEQTDDVCVIGVRI